MKGTEQVDPGEGASQVTQPRLCALATMPGPMVFLILILLLDCPVFSPFSCVPVPHLKV